MINLDVFRQFLRQHAAVKNIYLGFSGGVDSCVLLHLLMQMSGIEDYAVQVIHVHHGVSDRADEWQQWCARYAQDYQVSFRAESVIVKPMTGESLEQVAREARYDVFRQAMDAQSVLLTAHHQDDQAETLLLQLLRGAGVKGLAAMPFSAKLGEGWHVRPLLDYSRGDLLGYAKGQQLDWLEDESNTDERFDRNYLRHRVMPLLKQRWPAASKTIARSAYLCAEAATMVDNIAALDWEGVQQNGLLDLSQLEMLSNERQQAVLRYAIRQLGLPMCSQAKGQEILTRMLQAREDANPLVSWSGAEARRYQGKLYLAKPLPSFDSQSVISVSVEESLKLPGGLGELHWQQDKTGIKLSAQDLLTIRFRQGGETIKFPQRNGTFCLKKLMQQWGISPWLRQRVPLLYCHDELIAVVGYSCGERHQRRWVIYWHH